MISFAHLDWNAAEEKEAKTKASAFNKHQTHVCACKLQKNLTMIKDEAFVSQHSKLIDGINLAEMKLN